MSDFTRRNFLATTAAASLAPTFRQRGGESSIAPLKVGIVTYNIAKDWDLPTILKNCQETKFDGVELRTGHAHKVELALGASERADVRRRFDDSPVKLAQLGSTYEFHAVDAAEVRRNIEGCKQYIQLARDVGCPGVKVRPNGLQTRAGIPVEKTLEQIGKSLREIGSTASDNGVEVRVEVHGNGTSRLDTIEKIMAVADHAMVVVNWNSNQVDLEGGTLEENFARVAKKIRHVHTRDLYVEEYPFRRLVGLLQGIRFAGYCCAEIPESSDPLRVMRYYRALLAAYGRAA